MYNIAITTLAMRIMFSAMLYITNASITRINVLMANVVMAIFR
jgi:hypothetical protein